MSDLAIDGDADIDPVSCRLILHLCCRFHDRIGHALDRRREPWRPGLRPETDLAAIRADLSWRVQAIPGSEQALDRVRDSLRVHVVVSADDDVGLAAALNSNAPGLQIDLDDAHCPSWRNTLRVQRQLTSFCHSSRFHAASPVLGFRPRSLHIPDGSVRFRGKPVPGALVDMAVFVASNADAFVGNRFACGPVFYFPKVESYEEAVIWADILRSIEEWFPALHGNLKSIVMMENVRAAYQMEEILFALRESVIAANLGRFDYVFSFIKQFPDKILPPRSKISSQPFLQSCLRRMVFICRRRGALATTGMCPCLCPTSANLKAALDAKRLEANIGSFGALVAHLDFVDVVRDAFADVGDGPSRPPSMDSLSETVAFQGRIGEDDVSEALRVALHLCRSWISGRGTAVVDDNMEDLATAEVCRSLVWQWCRAQAFDLQEAIATARRLAQAEGCQAAVEIVIEAIQRDPMVPFLTDYLVPIVQADRTVL